METRKVYCVNCATKQTKEIIPPEDSRRYFHSIECDKCGSQGLKLVE